MSRTLADGVGVCSECGGAVTLARLRRQLSDDTFPIGARFALVTGGVWGVGVLPMVYGFANRWVWAWSVACLVLGFACAVYGGQRVFEKSGSVVGEHGGRWLAFERRVILSCGVLAGGFVAALAVVCAALSVGAAIV